MTLEKIEEIRRKRIKTYHVLDFTLDSARDNEVLHITGSYIYILNLDGACSIRLNEASSDSIDLLKFRVISSPFYRFFLTHPAQAGKTLKLAIGVESEFFSLQDFQSPDLAVLTGYGQELRNNFSYNYGTQVSKNAVLAAAGTIILHTVTAGKILLLEHYSFSCDFLTAGTLASLIIRNALDVTQYEISYRASVSTSRSGSLILQIPENYDVCLYLSATASFYGFIKGRET